MRTVLVDVPYNSSPKTLAFDGETKSIEPQRLIVWLSLTTQTAPLDPSRHRVFPAVIDTGYGGNFVLRGTHVTAWAGLTVDQLAVSTPAEYLHNHPVPRFRAQLWLHVEQPPPFDDAKSRLRVFQRSMRLRTEPGVTLILADLPKHVRKMPDFQKVAARTPDHILRFASMALIGMKLLEQNRMHLSVNTVRRTFSLATERTDWSPSTMP